MPASAEHPGYGRFRIDFHGGRIFRGKNRPSCHLSFRASPAAILEVGRGMQLDSRTDFFRYVSLGQHVETPQAASRDTGLRVVNDRALLYPVQKKLSALSSRCQATPAPVGGLSRRLQNEQALLGSRQVDPSSLEFENDRFVVRSWIATVE